MRNRAIDFTGGKSAVEDRSKRFVAWMISLMFVIAMAITIDLYGNTALAQTDTDGDGIFDVDDIDDDNDGILDTDEFILSDPAPGSSGVTATPYQSTGVLETSNGTFSGTAISMGVGDIAVFELEDTGATGTVAVLMRATLVDEDADDALVSLDSDDNPAFHIDANGAAGSAFETADFRLEFFDPASTTTAALLGGGGGGAELTSNYLAEVADIDGRVDRIERVGIAVQDIDALIVDNPSTLDVDITNGVVTVTGTVNDPADVVEFVFENRDEFQLQVAADAGSARFSLNFAQTVVFADSQVITVENDSDGDSILNFADLDSDNDGASDLVESGDTAGIAADTNGDGTVSIAEADAADGGAGDGDDNNNGLMDVFGAGSTGTTPRNTDSASGDVAFDFLDLDSDGDGIPDATEARASVDYVAYAGSGDAADTDDDGILDIYDDNAVFGSTDAGFVTLVLEQNDDDGSIPDIRDTDSDGDGTSDADEGGNLVTGISFTDPDGDVNDPLDGSSSLPNLDGNTSDVDFRSLAPLGQTDTDGDGIFDPDDIDDDNDGIKDIDEFILSDPIAGTSGVVADALVVNGVIETTNGTYTFVDNNTPPIVMNIGDIAVYELENVLTPGTVVALMRASVVDENTGSGNVEIGLRGTGGTDPLFQIIGEGDGASAFETGDFRLEFFDPASITVADLLLGNSGTPLVSNYLAAIADIDSSATRTERVGIAVQDIDAVTVDDPSTLVLEINEGVVNATGTVINPPDIIEFVFENRSEFQFQIAHTTGSAAGFEMDLAQTTVFSNPQVINVENDTDGDGILNFLDLDSDNDGVGDLLESGDAPGIAADTNGDGTVSLAEADVADGGAGDGDDNNNGLMDVFGTADIGTTPQNTDSGSGGTVADFLDLDSDGDGIPDATEARASAAYVAYAGTGDAADTDDDGILDIYDDATVFGSTNGSFIALTSELNDDDATTPDIYDDDSDGDGLLDSAEGGSSVTGVAFTDPDGDVNDPLGGGSSLPNVDADPSDVDFRSFLSASVDSKTFDPDTIAAGDTSTLTIALGNANTTTATLTADLVDTLPAGMTVASVPNIGGTCTGNVTAVAGSDTITYSAFGNGLSSVGGSNTNAVGPISPEGTAADGINSATLNGTNGPLVLTLEDTVPSGTVITVSLARNNTNGDVTVTDGVNSVTFNGGTIDVLTRITLTTGTATDTITFNRNAGSLRIDGVEYSAATIPNGGCTIEVDVTSTTPGTVTNTIPIGALQTSLGNNTAEASDDLTVTAVADVSVAKTLVDSSPYTTNDTVTFTIAASNAGPNTASNVTITDTPNNVSITGVTDDDAGNLCTTATLQSGCNIGSLTNGQTITFTVTATIDSEGAFSNDVAISADETDPNAGNDTDSAGGTAGGLADVSVTKTLTDTSPYLTNDTVTFTIAASNAGPDTAENVTITDTPANVTITGVTDDDAGNLCTTATLQSGCNIGSLTNGQTITFTVTATIDSEGAFSNDVAISADETDPNAGNDTDSAGGTAGGLADVSVTKTLTDTSPYLTGDTVTFTLIASNAGPDTAENVTITDTTTNVTITGVTDDDAGNLCTTATLQSGCNIGSLTNGQTITFTVTATIDSEGAFSNDVAISADETDPNAGNDTDSAGGTAGGLADVSVTKTLTDTSPYLTGDTVTFTLIASNAGPDTAENVTITDTPANVTITGVTDDDAGNLCTTATLQSGCNIGSLTNGQTITFTVTATIDSEGAFSNDVAISADETDPNAGNDTDSAGGSAGGLADVSITKTLTDTSPYLTNDTVTFTIAASNAGPDTAENVTITDTATNVTITGVTDDDAGNLCTTATLQSGCNIGSLTNGQTITFMVTATIDSEGAFSNDVAISADETDPNAGNDTDSAGGTAGGLADVSVTKTLTDTSPYLTNDTITFTIAASNAGPDTAENVTITDTPANVTITGVTDDDAGNLCTTATLQSGCNIGSLTNGQTITFTVTATIDSEGAFSNDVAISADETDPNAGNDTDSAGGSAGGLADVSITKSLVDSSPYSVGQTITFTLIASNAGPDTAENVTITDIPTDVTITGVTDDDAGNLCTTATLQSGCNIGSLTNGQTITFTVTATIDASVSAFSNSVSITADETDNVPSNNSSSDGGSVSDADVSVTKSLVDTSPYFISDTVTFTIVASNAGPGTANNVTITDTTTTVTITGVTDDDTGNLCTTATLQSGCNIGALTNGQAITFTVTATINGEGAFDNAVTISADENDPNAGDNTDNAGGTAGGLADVSITKTLTDSSPYETGDTVTFTMVANNAGPGSATNVVITDTPDNLTLATVTDDAGDLCTTATLESGCSIGTLTNGQTITFTVTATVDGPGDFNNAVAISLTETDPDTGNNSDDGSGDGNNGDTALGVLLTPRVLLQGALNVPGTFTFTTIMRDDLRVSDQEPGATIDFLPDTEPYTALPNFTHVGGGGETVATPATVFADNGNNSIVDWVFVELRDSADNTSVVATRAGLLRRDGDVVDVDGTSPLLFSSPMAASYFVAIRHRNHLGVMTENAIPLSETVATVDFSDPAIALFDTAPVNDGLEQFQVPSSSVQALWAGNVGGDSSVVFTGQDDDTTPLFNEVTQAPGSGGSAIFVHQGYHQSDANMNSAGVFTGQNNDTDLIFNNISQHPANGGGSAIFVIVEQLP